MAQAWHNRRRQTGDDFVSPARCWRASEYRLAAQTFVEAVPGSAWERYDPFGSYSPGSKTREVNAGPHLMFLRLRRLWEEEADAFLPALQLFAREWGLLGAFEEDYLPHPVFPEGKMLVAPEAVIDRRGGLQRIDPSTEGLDLLLKLLGSKGWILGRRDPGAGTEHSLVAMPSEIRFSKKNPALDSEGWPLFPPRDLVPWTDVQRDFGALLILDSDAFKGVSVLYTREPLRRWSLGLRFFPTGDTPAQDLVSGAHNSLNSYLQEASPQISIDENGNLHRGWYYRGLLQAMHVMLYLDLTGGSTIKKCESRGCPNYFRIGSQERSKYCSTRCGNRASTRMSRGQEP